MQTTGADTERVVANGRVLSVNISGVRSVPYGGATVTTGIFKAPFSGRVAVACENVRGDEQADRDKHGGPTRAVYAYAAEDYRWWSASLGRSLAPGTFGENLTLTGLDVTNARVGERWRIGTAILEVTSPRVPCAKLAMVMEDPAFVKRFAAALRPGAYLAVVEEGEIGAGDAVERVFAPAHALTLATMTQIYFFEHERAAELLVAELPPKWRDWARERAAPAR